MSKNARGRPTAPKDSHQITVRLDGRNIENLNIEAVENDRNRSQQLNHILTQRYAEAEASDV